MSSTDERLNSSAEIDSLAAEIVHAYEELHLLYELGDVLTSDLSLGEVTNLLVEKILHALRASQAELSLIGSSETVQISDGAVLGSVSDERCLTTTLRSAGGVVGAIKLARSEAHEPFSSPDAKLLDAVGGLAANAIRKVQLVQEVRSNEAHLRAVLDNVAEGILTVDNAKCIASFNPAAERIFGYSARDVIGQHIRLLLDHPQPGETTAHHSDGRVFPVELSIGQMREHDEHLLIYSVRDITRRKQAEAAIEHQALHDGLTNLPNRVLLHDRMQQAIRASQRDNTSVALLVMDVDRFKDVNDTFGHHIGDLLLEQLGERLGSALRTSDTIARLGGDEFAILLPTATYEDARQIADRLQHLLEQPFALGGLQLEIDASIGIALAPEHASDADTLLRRADVAMYVAKRANNAYALYTTDRDQHSPMRLALVAELRRAIEQDELSLYFQPKVNMETGTVFCAEALVRWQHPRHGMLSPDLFVPIAEQTGLIRPLSRWVMDAALRQVNRWRQDGLDLSVAVNLSMRNLHDPEIAEMIRQVLQRWGVPPTCLTIEITESSLMADAARAMEVLNRLRAMGVSISIDDFGTGYSSLAYLKRLPVHELKIDKSFVAHMATDENDATIVRSTVGLAHDLGLLVVAEGVEDQGTWDRLAAVGCDVAQGYFISRPLPPLVLGDWLASSSWDPRLARAA